MRYRLLLASILLGMCAACGTTRWSDTQRTATEQLLVSDAIDRAIGGLDFHVLSGRTAYLDATGVRASTDAAYLASSIRQQMLAHGCILRDKRDEADFVVELRAGAIGTDRQEVLFGIPATRVPEPTMMPTVPAAIPELPLAKKTEQRAVAKVALFAYNRVTGRPVWQSGTIPIESKVKDLWVLGAGPYQRGTVVDQGKVAKKKATVPILRPGDYEDSKHQPLQITEEAYFLEPTATLSQKVKLRPKREEPAPAPKETPPAGPEEAAKAKPAPELLTNEVTQAKPIANRSAAKPETDAKSAEPAGPLDAVVPASHVEPAPVASQPNSGMDGFWPLASSQPAATPVALTPPAAITSSGTATGGTQPLGTWLHEYWGRGK